MGYYDYREGKKRVEEILKNKLEVIEQDKIPKDENFTYTNAYYGWVSSIFVDIRDSTNLFSNEDKEKVSKVIRAFTSEIIEILRDNENLRQIGIRGDCVYAVYTAPTQNEIYELYNTAAYINTYLKMLNKLLKKYNLPTIEAGIGIGIDKELVVKAGRKGVGICDSVWIGKAVTGASNLSSYGNKHGIDPICLSKTTYINIIDQIVSASGEKAKEWFKQHYDDNNDIFYSTDMLYILFNSWIEEGMTD